MRYGIIGDIHGADLFRIDKEFERLEVDFGICVGDFESVKTVRQMIEIQRADRIPWFVVPGNHEHMSAADFIAASLPRQRYSYDPDNWLHPSNIDARNYVERMLSEETVRIKRGVSARQIVIDIDGLGKTIIMHGAYSGISWGDPPDLWNRLQNESNYAENFEIMERNGHKVMIRGHDHPQMYGHGNAKKATLVLGNPGQSFDLKPEFMHTINPGALCDGLFATLVDRAGQPPKLPRLSYHE